jgi:hypothetical protein
LWSLKIGERSTIKPAPIHAPKPKSEDSQSSTIKLFKKKRKPTPKTPPKETPAKFGGDHFLFLSSPDIYTNHKSKN